MKTRLIFFIRYFVFWLVLFLLAKCVFLLYHMNHTITLNAAGVFGIFRHGLLLDLSAVSYITLTPLILLLLTSYSKGTLPFRLISIYTLIVMIPVIIFTLADLEVFKYWGTRLDNTALRFISTPREMLASAAWITIFLLFAGFVALNILAYLLYRRKIAMQLAHSEKPRWKGLLVFLLLVPFLLLLARGGTGIAPISVSRVYFHPDPYPNFAAINVLWNVGHSWLEKKDQPNPFQYLDDETAGQYVGRLYHGDSGSTVLLNTPQPNIILVILESFTSKLVEPLGGLPGVTPNFNTLCNESILFTNLLANDSRTDKSLVSILSGYPALGKISIIKFPDKTQKLGIITREMVQAGYHTSFYYGGDIDFANMRSYLVNGNFQQVISVDDYEKSQQTGRWGVHDQITFQRLYDDCNTSQQPFFKTLLSLSNHEPFDIPGEPKFGNSTIDTRVSSSAFYTDSCIGDFIRKAKLTAWWKNTLIIMLADHGTKFPGNTVVYYPEKYRIPMIWTGGAIRSDTVISTYLSQSDLAKTLLHQLNLNASAYPLSKDIFGATHNFAFYEFNNGFGMMSDSGSYVFDNDLNRIILNQGTVSEYFLQAGKAIQQEVYNVFLGN
ncbi:MAG TPA: LTA synthase family protein [Bacteroidales bacterium]|nr:LTA synthase family protein [Bacteroidales bacterium]